jgi:hypothetical protein
MKAVTTAVWCVFLSCNNEDRRFVLLLSWKEIRGAALWIVAIESSGLNSSEIYEKNFYSKYHVSVTYVAKEMEVLSICQRYVLVPSIIIEVIFLLLINPRNTKLSVYIHYCSTLPHLSASMNSLFYVCTINGLGHLHDFRLPLRSSWELRSSALLRIA